MGSLDLFSMCLNISIWYFHLLLKFWIYLFCLMVMKSKSDFLAWECCAGSRSWSSGSSLGMTDIPQLNHSVSLFGTVLGALWPREADTTSLLPHCALPSLTFLSYMCVVLGYSCLILSTHCLLLIFFFLHRDSKLSEAKDSVFLSLNGFTVLAILSTWRAPDTSFMHPTLPPDPKKECFLKSREVWTSHLPCSELGVTEVGWAKQNILPCF